MLDMGGIEQRDQYIDVEQKRHGNSSFSWATSSGVTGVASDRNGSNGTPLRIAGVTAVLGRSPWRANPDTHGVTSTSHQALRIK